MQNKKAQLKIQEMAFVLVAVVFLFSLLFLFFARFQHEQIIYSAEKIREQRTVSMLKAVAGLPELTCTIYAVCIDQDKLEAFNNSSGLREDYSELWKNSFITKVIVKEVYPPTEQEYTIYKDTKTYESVVTYSTFIPLCEESIAGSSCVIAKIKITVIMPE